MVFYGLRFPFIDIVRHSNFTLEECPVGRKWNNIKMKKAATDKLRSQQYTKVLKEVTVAVKNAGHAEVEANFALKIALLKARQYNVPKDNVDKAIKKGLGEGGNAIEEINYEGYGLDGVGIFIEAATDNPTRTVSNIRSYFNKFGGALGTPGCLSSSSSARPPSRSSKRT
jgi:YebC/PmpR family DNA-binding regulatory protein